MPRETEAPPRKPKICHIINALYVGGAEMMLCKLLESLQKRNEFEFSVITLLDGGPLVDQIERLGIPVQRCHMQQGKFRWKEVKHLRNLIRSEQPDLVQTWMYHSDLLGGVATKLANRRTPVVWNIRHSHLSQESDKRSTRLVGKLLARLSHYLPHRVIVNSQVGKSTHLDLGYRPELFEMIPNGFDLEKFRPSHQDRHSVVKELELPDSVKLIGHVGRFHSMKRHQLFIEAAGRLASEGPQYHFVMVGRGVGRENDELMEWIKATDYPHRFHLLGPRQDLPRLQAAFDLMVSSSGPGEGFSNVLGEAMASSTPCVATDAGDAKFMLGETGLIVPVDDLDALHLAMRQLLTAPEAELWGRGLAARKRIRENFTMSRITDRYTELWNSCLPALEESVEPEEKLKRKSA
ncbi:Putative glycosyltransferase EpsF [Polystyrenella longa]|uniref:Glycosyltransferase EpsF n=1 Tax=Polystyrenella longa TaxID=2528007 RepID=A0A518CUB0_9PLAN|nr:glycosyltransferase [Polystyrenella longa]QDU82819.1 Putative glycosyltransferase EpsF [Polystyrenella longa]